ncbi:carboxypeptidase-like regulatory domain-containing protein [Puia sp. P3]|uniref:carboxypeptidase-like regulatory domain-containing protein n=1 Tax=Puia sp. P3 TaxID=3423952 RepID=UPI003D674358
MASGPDSREWVRQRRQRTPLRGASVTIKDSYDGGTADSLGNFRFKTTEKGNMTLVITNIGYNSLEQPISLTGTPVELRLTMKETLSELKAVTITAGSFTAGDAKRERSSAHST